MGNNQSDPYNRLNYYGSSPRATLLTLAFLAQWMWEGHNGGGCLWRPKPVQALVIDHAKRPSGD